jgi:predicted DsbA family dithiol-disulfide isomerase
MTDVTETTGAAVRLDLWADIACPWCYLGSVRLDAVLDAAAERGEQIVLRHRPFQLDPTLPPEGLPMAGHLEAKFGSADAVREAQARLTALGAEEGIRYDFDAVGKAPNTRLAHHLLSTYDGDPRQRTATRALYSAYFEQGRDITDAEVLVDAVAAATGDDPASVRARLDAAPDALEADLRLGRGLGVSSVPTFVADAGSDVDPAVGLSAAAVAMTGAQPAEALDHLLAEARRRAS